MAWLGDGGSGGKPGGGAGGGLTGRYSGGGGLRLTSPTSWLGSGTGTSPIPLNDQETRIAKSFSTLPATERLNTLNMLKSKAQNGDQASVRKLQYLAPVANQNVPNDPNYHSAMNDFWMGAGHLIGDSVKGVADSLKNTGQDIVTAPHILNAAGMALGSMARGDGSAATKQKVLNEARKSSLGQDVFGNAKTVNQVKQQSLGGEGARLGGRTLEDVLNVATLGEGTLGKQAVEQTGKEALTAATGSDGANFLKAANAQSGFAKIRDLGNGQFAKTAIHPQDADIMDSFIDHARGNLKLNPDQAKQLGHLADMLSEHYKIGQNATTDKQLASAFQRILTSGEQEAGFLKVPSGASKLMSGDNKVVQGAKIGAAYGVANAGQNNNPNEILPDVLGGAATGGILGAGFHVGGKVVGELRAPGQIRALQRAIDNYHANQTTAGHLGMLQDLINNYQQHYDAQMRLPAGAQAPEGPLALPAHASVPFDETRVPGGGVMIDPNSPQAQVIANAGKPNLAPPMPDVPGKNVTDIAPKPATPDMVAKAGASLVDKAPGLPTSHEAPVAKTNLNDLMQQWSKINHGGATKVSKLELLNNIIEHPDASPQVKQMALEQRHDIIHDNAKDAVAQQEAKQTGENIGVARTKLAMNQGTGDNQDLFNAIHDHQVTGSPQRIAYDYNPNEAEGHEPIPMNELHPGARNVFAETNKVAAGDVKGAPLNREFVSSVYHGLANKVQQLAKGMSEHDLKLINDIEFPKQDTAPTSAEAAQRVLEVSAKADNPQQFRRVVEAMREGKDTRYASDVHGLGRDMGYIQNHLTHVYEFEGRPESPHAGGQPGYTKQRVIMTRAEAEALAKQTNEDGTPKYPNLKLADMNAVQAHTLAMKQAAYEHGNQGFLKGLNEAHPNVEFSNKTNNGYQQLNGTNITAPRGLAATYNKRLNVPRTPDYLGIKMPNGDILPVHDEEIAQRLKDTGGTLVDGATGKSVETGKAGRMIRQLRQNGFTGNYDKVNAALKTSILGGGTFHAVTTAGSVGGQQLMRAFTNPADVGNMLRDNLSLVKGTFSKAQHAANMEKYNQSGLLDFARKAGATLEYNGNIDVSRTHIPVISDIHDTVFQRQIPEAKLMIMQQSMERKFPGMDFRNPTPEQIAWGRKAASAVNNLGGINRAIEGLSPSQARMLGRVILAPDYTEGKFRTIGNIWKPGPEGNIARQMVVGKSVLFALPGLIALGAAGKLHSASDWGHAILGQIMDPGVPLNEKGAPTKTNPGGTPQAVHLPTTFISEIGKVVKPIVDHLTDPAGNPDALSGVKSYASNRLAALPGLASKVAQNKDFYGKPIITNNPVQSAGNLGLQVAPIPVGQGVKLATGQESPTDAALNTAGFRVSNDTTSPQSTHSAAVNRTYNAFNGVLAQQTKIAKQVNNLIGEGKINEAHRLAQQWNSTLPSKAHIDAGITNPDARTAWQAKWKTLEIKTSSRSDLTRAKDAKQNAALLK